MIIFMIILKINKNIFQKNVPENWIKIMQITIIDEWQIFYTKNRLLKVNLAFINDHEFLW